MGGCVMYTEFMIYLFLCNFFLHFSLSLIFRLQMAIFVSFFSVPLKATQRAHDVYTTSARRRCNVMTLHWRWSDVVLTSCACWVESWKLDTHCDFGWIYCVYPNHAAPAHSFLYYIPGIWSMSRVYSFRLSVCLFICVYSFCMSVHPSVRPSVS